MELLERLFVLCGRLRLACSFTPFLTAALLLLGSCTGIDLPDDNRLSDRLTANGDASEPIQPRARSASSGLNFGQRQQGAFTGTIKAGTDQLVGSASAERHSSNGAQEEKITLNLVDVPIATAAKAILSDVLGASYSVDGRVQGTVTLQTSQPMAISQVVQTFESVLRANGASIVRQGDFYRIVPGGEGTRTVSRIETPSQDGQLAGLGVRTQVITLNFVAADELRQVLEPIVPEGAIKQVDVERNAIVLSGTSAELAAMRENIALFDVDWLKGMSFALFPVKSSDPQLISQELDTIFGTAKGPLKGIVRFVPNKRLSAILVISKRSRYLREAAGWIRKLDGLAEGNDSDLYVYNVQNRSASELAKVLQAVFRSKDGQQVAVETTGVAPRLEASVVRSGATEDSAQFQPPATSKASDNDTNGGSDSGIKVVADDANNALLIVAPANEYQRMLSVLERIDTIPNQVLLEAIIAEVTLNDQLNFGVRWFFGKSKHGVTFSDVANGAVASTFPGFSYFLATKNIDVALNALSSVTDVNVISSPSLMVLDNHTATLQVGDQVPVAIQQANNVTAPGAPIVNQIELKDTGIILSVTPRVNDSGRVILDIEQEVSSVVQTTSSGIDSPTIRQRKISTTVVVNDGETLTLGGLIQELDERGQAKVPLLGDIPFLGAAFRNRKDTIDRTELIIFIRPRVIRDIAEARRVTAEFRRQLSIQAPKRNRGNTKFERDIKRIIE